MKQVLQSYRTGRLEIADVPAPGALPKTVLVRTTASLISAGTEKMVIELARKSLAGKARERPDLVKKVIEKVSKDGLVPTAQAVVNKLDVPIPLGYSAAGVVIEVGAGVEGIRPGDRVACAGAKVANHAEYNVVPVNLCASVPNGVSDEAAAFATVGAIALHGMRCAAPQLGESVAVIGLGLLGQLALQLARGQGCHTVGIDLDPAKVKLALDLGADAAVVRTGDVAGAIASVSRGRGVDVVLICAATDSNDPLELAAEIVRDRGTIVAVGAVGLDIPRRPFYDKEVKFVVSRAYGPGRYDPHYEDEGNDYPYGYVRWTEGRNLQAFLDACGSGRVDVARLISHRFPIQRAEEAYALVTEGTEPFLGVMLTYPDVTSGPDRTVDAPNGSRLAQAAAALSDVKSRLFRVGGKDVRVGVVGSGNFASAVLIPALAKAPGAALEVISSARGVTARHAASKHSFRQCTTDSDSVLRGPTTDAVVIATRHDLHAEQVAAALASSKHVFVEKPIAISLPQLQSIAPAMHAHGGAFLAGYNRRFAPLAQRMRTFLALRRAPMVMVYRINAGAIPPESWIQDPKVGGGRIVGEACHFIDFGAYLADALPVAVSASSVRGAVLPMRDDDQVTMNVRYADGSLATIIYTSGGEASMPKEYIEAHAGGRSALLDDFRMLELWTNGSRERHRDLVKDKGHRAEMEHFVRSCREPSIRVGVDVPIAVTLATLGALVSLDEGREVALSVADCSLR